MMLGKRPRPSMRRTTSLSEINPGASTQRPRYEDPSAERLTNVPEISSPIRGKSIDLGVISFVAALEPAHFLRICGFCNQHLGPGKDTFIYRGDVAFCSAECRQRRMNLDEKMEKCSVASRLEPAAQEAESAASGEIETAVTA